LMATKERNKSRKGNRLRDFGEHRFRFPVGFWRELFWDRNESCGFARPLEWESQRSEFLALRGNCSGPLELAGLWENAFGLL